MFQVSERENTENGKWLESRNAFSQGNRICKLHQSVYKVLGPIQQIIKYKLQLFHTPLTTPFLSSFFNRIKLIKQFNQYNNTIQKMTSGVGFSV